MNPSNCIALKPPNSNLDFFWNDCSFIHQNYYRNVQKPEPIWLLMTALLSLEKHMWWNAVRISTHGTYGDKHHFICSCSDRNGASLSMHDNPKGLGIKSNLPGKVSVISKSCDSMILYRSHKHLNHTLLAR